MGDRGEGSRFDRFREGFGRGRDGNRGEGSRDGLDTAPCPDANGTAIGTFQQFTLQCGLNIEGQVLEDTAQPDFLTCVDRCASFHPRCDGVSYDGRDCRLRAGVDGSQTRPAAVFDSALGIFPDMPASGCPSAGTRATAGTATSTSFDVSCNFILNGNDLFQEHRNTFRGCLDLCADTTGCNAVSFDPTMNLGFKNCYLKTGLPPDGLLGNPGIDSAVVSNGAAPPVDPAPVPAPSAPPASPVAPPAPPAPPANPPGVVPVPVPPSPAPAPTPTVLQPLPGAPVTLTPLVPAQPVTTSGAQFFTPSPAPAGGAASVVPGATPPLSSSTVTNVRTQTSTADGGSTTVVTQTQILTLPVPADGSALTTTMADGSIVVVGGNSTNGIGAGAGGSGGGAEAGSQAWIAAPVVGSVAAVMVIAVVFVMWGRKRGGSLAGFAAWIRGWLPRSSNGRGLSRNGDGGGGSLRSANFRFNPEDDDAAGRDPKAPMRYFGNFWRAAGVGTGREGAKARVRDPEAGRGAGDDGSRGSSRNGLTSRSSNLAGGNSRETTPVYEVKQGKMALRDSMNGLTQHKPTLDGIPGFLRRE